MKYVSNVGYLVLFLLIPSFAQSADCNGDASFNCSTASTPSDRIICSSSQLRRADCALGQSYKTARDAAVNDSQKKQLRDQQRVWIKTRDRSCGTQPSMSTEQCFLNATTVRKSELDRLLNSSNGPSSYGDEYKSDTNYDHKQLANSSNITACRTACTKQFGTANDVINRKPGTSLELLTPCLVECNVLFCGGKRWCEH